MIEWSPFSSNGKQYDLAHLWPDEWNYVQQGNSKNPERTYRIRIIYSLHTFTRGRETNIDLDYSDARETRTFCSARYDKSFMLPKIIKQLDQGYIFHTSHKNFLRIDIGSENSYEVFFTVQKSKEPNKELQIYVQSSYERTKGNSPKAGKIRFSVVAYNTLHNKVIKPPRR
jgi:hypothetical protein